MTYYNLWDTGTKGDSCLQQTLYLTILKFVRQIRAIQDNTKSLIRN